MKTLHVVVQGDVQNVGFRSWVKHKAEFIGVNGWVKNLDDDKVEGLFQAEDKKVYELVEECKRGPPGSYVENVKINEEESDEFNSFEILK